MLIAARSAVSRSLLDIHPTQWRQLNDYLEQRHPHVD